MANVIKWHHCSVPTNKCSLQHTSYSVTGHFNSLCAQLYWENIKIYLHTGAQSLHTVVAIRKFMLHVWYMQQSSPNMHSWVPYITWSNVTRYCLHHCRNRGTISVKGSIHKRHQPHTFPQWGVFCEYLFMKLTHVLTALYLDLQF